MNVFEASQLTKAIILTECLGKMHIPRVLFRQIPVVFRESLFFKMVGNVSQSRSDASKCGSTEITSEILFTCIGIEVGLESVQQQVGDHPVQSVHSHQMIFQLGPASEVSVGGRPAPLNAMAARWACGIVAAERTDGNLVLV